jgi:hypothetical protein
MVMDVMLSDADINVFSGSGAQLTVLYDRSVVYDSQTSGARPGAMRSSFQKEYDGHLCTSLETLYVLAGPRGRKHASLPALLALEKMH